MIHHREEITKQFQFAFGRCLHCEGAPDRFLFAGPLFWALCTQCRTAWWAMFSDDGWGQSEVEAREAISALDGWDVDDEQMDAYVTGTRGEFAFVKLMGLQWPKDALKLHFRTSEGTPIHVRTSRFEEAPLFINPNDNDDDIFVHVTGTGRSYRLWGCIQGKEAKNSKWLERPDPARPPIFFVPIGDHFRSLTTVGPLEAIPEFPCRVCGEFTTTHPEVAGSAHNTRIRSEGR